MSRESGVCVLCTGNIYVGGRVEGGGGGGGGEGYLWGEQGKGSRGGSYEEMCVHEGVQANVNREDEWKERKSEVCNHVKK